MISEPFSTPLNFNPSGMENPDVFYYEMMRIAMSKLCITAPGKVLEYDRTTHRARIQPLLKIRYSNDETRDAQPITVDVMRFCAGGFLIDFPIKAGDTGWFVSSDKDVTRIKETGETNLPSSAETHSFKRGFWIPDNWQDTEVSDDGLVLQSVDGTQKVVVKKDGVDITGTAITINGPTTINGTLTMKDTITMANEVVLDTHVHTCTAPDSPSGGPLNAQS